MKKLTILFALLTLSVGLWAVTPEEAREQNRYLISQEVAKFKKSIDDASNYEAAKELQEQTKANLDECANTALGEVNAATEVEDMDNIRKACVEDMRHMRDDAIVEIDKINKLEDAKVEAIKDITTARQGILNTELNALIDEAINNIQKATTEEQITDIKDKIVIPIKSFQDGKIEMKAELLGNMAEPCTGCTAVEVTDGTTTVTLYNATNVGYIKK